MRPQARAAIVLAAIGHGGSVERVDGRIAGRVEAEGEPGARWMGIGADELRELVVAAGWAVADPLLGPEADPTDGCQNGVVETGSPLQVTYADGEVSEHWRLLAGRVPRPGLPPPSRSAPPHPPGSAAGKGARSKENPPTPP